MNIKHIPAGPQIESFQNHQFDENLGTAPLSQKPTEQAKDAGGPKTWGQFMRFLDKARKALDD